MNVTTVSDSRAKEKLTCHRSQSTLTTTSRRSTGFPPVIRWHFVTLVNGNVLLGHVPDKGPVHAYPAAAIPIVGEETDLPSDHSSDTPVPDER
jgi:hypothetical protein